MAEQREPILMCAPEELSLMRRAASEAQRRGMWVEAEGVLDGLALMEPNDPLIFASLGYVQHRQNKLETAEQNYRRAIELTEWTDTGSMVNLVGVHILQGRGQDAIEMLQKVVDSGDRRPEIVDAISRLETALAQ